MPTGDRGVAAEAALPQLVADDRHGVASGQVLLRCEESPPGGADTEHREDLGARPRGGQAFGLAATGEVDGAEAESHHRLERAAFLAISQELGLGEARLRLVLPAVPDLDDALRLRVGQRLQEDAVDQAEHGRVGADAQRQRQRRHGGESGAFDQATNCEAEVQEQTSHDGTS
jgi:hypothetical protein